MNPPRLVARPAVDSRGFTLVESLAAVAVITVLAALLVPAVNSSIARAKQSRCAGNLRAVGQAVAIYSSDNSGFLPPSNTYVAGEGRLTLWETLRPYLDGGAKGQKQEIWQCPSAKFRSAPDGGIAPAYSGNPKLFVDLRADSGNANDPTKVPAHIASFDKQAVLAAIFDAGQREDSHWALPTLIGAEVNGSGPAGKADTPITGVPITSPDTDTGNGIRYRHPFASVNVLFLDGHVEALKKGGVLHKNIFVY